MSKKTTLLSAEIFGVNEIEIHYKRPLFNTMKYMKCANDVYHLLLEFVDTKRIDYKEFFWVVLLNRANRVIGISEIAVGNSSHVNVDVKEICQLALLTDSTNVLVCHCHPSGTLQPSEADTKITRKIKKALQLFDIILLDHLIITSEDYYSFAEENIL